MARRVVCPVCSKSAGVSVQGRLMKHGRRRNLETGKPYGDFCAGTDKKVLEDRRPRGICRVCSEEHAVDTQGAIAPHGYKINAEGQSETECPGSRKKARQAA